MEHNGNLVEAAAPMDLLLTQAAVGPARRFLPGGSGLRFAGALARRPDRLATRLGGLAGELARVAVGASEVALRLGTGGSRTRRGRRTRSAPARAGLSRGRGTVEGLAEDVPLEWRDAERVRFVTSNLVAAAAPSNTPLISPVG